MPNNLEFQLDWVSIDLIFESLIGGKKDSAQPLYCFLFFFNIQTNYYHQNFGYFCNEGLRPRHRVDPALYCTTYEIVKLEVLCVNGIVYFFL